MPADVPRSPDASHDALDIWRMVAARRRVEGRLPLAALTRLADSLVDTRGEVVFSLQFDTDTFKVPYVELQAETALPLLCQRLNPVDESVHVLPVLHQHDRLLQILRSEEQRQQRTEDDQCLAAEELKRPVRLEEVPEELVLSVLAAEDARFFEHGGISLLGIARAAIANLRGGEVRQGGSTLTQQLVKNLFLTHERTLSRKSREVVLALLVDLRYGKREILEAYLNEIYLGASGSINLNAPSPPDTRPLLRASRTFQGCASPWTSTGGCPSRVRASSNA